MTLHEEEEWYHSLTAISNTYIFAIETLEDKRFIGGCSINGVDWKNYGKAQKYTNEKNV